MVTPAAFWFGSLGGQSTAKIGWPSGSEIPNQGPIEPGSPGRKSRYSPQLCGTHRTGGVFPLAHGVVEDCKSDEPARVSIAPETIIDHLLNTRQRRGAPFFKERLCGLAICIVALLASSLCRMRTIESRSASHGTAFIRPFELQASKDLPQPQLCLAFGFEILKPPPLKLSM
jgi:hypothetical protein